MENFVNTILNSASWLPLTLCIIAVVILAGSITLILLRIIKHGSVLIYVLNRIWVKVIWYAPITVLIILSISLIHTFDQVPASSEKLNQLLENTDNYLVGDYANGCYMEIPSYIEDLPVEINVYDLDLEPVGTATIENWDDMPVSLDDLWYYYGMQETKDMYLQTNDNPLNYCMTFIYRPTTESTVENQEDMLASKKDLAAAYTICFPPTKSDLRPFIGYIMLFCSILILLIKIWNDILGFNFWRSSNWD